MPKVDQKVSCNCSWRQALVLLKRQINDQEIDSKGNWSTFRILNIVTSAMLTEIRVICRIVWLLKGVYNAIKSGKADKVTGKSIWNIQQNLKKSDNTIKIMEKL